MTKIQPKATTFSSDFTLVMFFVLRPGMRERQHDRLCVGHEAVVCTGQIQLSPTQILPPDFIGQDTKKHVLFRRVQASLSRMIFVPRCHILFSVKIS